MLVLVKQPESWGRRDGVNIFKESSSISLVKFSGIGSV